MANWGQTLNEIAIAFTSTYVYYYSQIFHSLLLGFKNDSYGNHWGIRIDSNEASEIFLPKCFSLKSF